MKILHVSGFICVLSIVALSCAKGPAPSEIWEAARALHEEEKFEESIAKYEELIARYPEDSLSVRARFTIADIYANSIKDFGAAVREYAKVQRAYPESGEAPKALFMMGYLYANSIKDFDKARDAYTEFSNLFPDHELAAAVEFEIENLGKEIEDIEALQSVAGSKGN